MRNQNARVRLAVVKWVALYCIALLIYCIIFMLRLFGRYRIFNEDRFPKEPEPILLVSNHPSYFVETIILLPGLFLRWVLRNPKWVAWNVPDETNFQIFRRWYLSWVLLRTIFMARHDLRKAAAAIKFIGVVLRAGQSVIFFPEGGRTSSGDGPRVYSASGKPMRCLQGGLGRIVVKTGAKVLLAWVEGTDKVYPRNARFPNLLKRMSVTLSEPMDFSHLVGRHTARERRRLEAEVESLVTAGLLALADERRSP